MQKIIIPLFGNDVAPRFDLASEVVIISWSLKTDHCEERVLVLPKSSAEQLCQLILTEEVQTVICGGIEEEYYQYLTWKQVHILDSVIGDWHHVFQAFKEGRLKPADIIYSQVD